MGTEEKKMLTYMVMTNINKENFGMVKLGLRKMKNKAFKFPVSKQFFKINQGLVLLKLADKSNQNLHRPK